MNKEQVKTKAEELSQRHQQLKDDTMYHNAREVTTRKDNEYAINLSDRSKAFWKEVEEHYDAILSEGSYDPTEILPMQVVQEIERCRQVKDHK